MAKLRIDYIRPRGPLDGGDLSPDLVAEILGQGETLDVQAASVQSAAVPDFAASSGFKGGVYARLAASGGAVAIVKGLNPVATSAGGILVPASGEPVLVPVAAGDKLAAIGIAGGGVVVQSGDLGIVAAAMDQVAGAAANALTSAIDLADGRLSRIITPALTAAVFTFQTSTDGVTFTDLYDEFGGEVTWQPGVTARSIRAQFGDWIGVRYLKVRSGTSAAPVAQAAARALTLVTVPK